MTSTTKTNKLGFTTRQVRPGFAMYVAPERLRELGYRVSLFSLPPAYQRFEAFQRIEYEAVMGRPPKLATPEELERFNSPAT